MLNITESDIFKLQDSSKIFTDKISAIIRRAMSNPKGDSDMVILNGKLIDSLQNLRKMYNDPAVLKAVEAVKRGDIVLLDLSAELSIPKCMPFVRYKASSNTKIMINVTPYLEKKKNSAGEDIYSISVQRLYPLLITAYLTLTTFTENYILPAKALNSAAYIWASMFNKVLVRTIALGTNKERYDAFMYFAMKFFCTYIAQVPDQISEDVARAYLIKKGRKEFSLVDDMAAMMKKLDYKPFESFRNFCLALFDNRVSNIRGIMASSSAKEMNQTFFLNRFVDQFTFTALFSLASFPYFVFSVLNAAYKTRVVNDAAFQDIINDKDYNVLALINAIL